jgi:ABC-type antimicrobial peptide transport system permease subunit
VALFLASFGLFSVACYSVAHRTREFGIRIALGAAPRTVLRTALQSILAAVGVGLVIGAASSAGLGAIVARWSIRNLDDPLVLAAVTGLLVIAVLMATLIPARRATAIDPVAAVKAE